MQHQVCQPQQVIFHTCQNPSIFNQFELTNFQTNYFQPPIATYANNIFHNSAYFQNSFPENYSNVNSQFAYSNCNNIVNCESSTSSYFSSSSSNNFNTLPSNSVKIQKTQKTKKNVNKKKHKIVLCNNEYEEKMFKIRNPNQTYYKFVER